MCMLACLMHLGHDDMSWPSRCVLTLWMCADIVDSCLSCCVPALLMRVGWVV